MITTPLSRRLSSHKLGPTLDRQRAVALHLLAGGDQVLDALEEAPCFALVADLEPRRLVAPLALLVLELDPERAFPTVDATHPRAPSCDRGQDYSAALRLPVPRISRARSSRLMVGDGWPSRDT